MTTTPRPDYLTTNTELVLGFVPGLASSSMLLNPTGGFTELIFNLTVPRILEVYSFTLAMAIVSGSACCISSTAGRPSRSLLINR